MVVPKIRRVGKMAASPKDRSDTNGRQKDRRTQELAQKDALELIRHAAEEDTAASLGGSGN